MQDKTDTLKKIERLMWLLGKCLLIAFLLVGVGTYVFFCPPVLTRTNGSFILFPMPPGEEYTCESVNNIKREEVFFKNDKGNNLHGWFFQSKNPKAPVILFCHGNAGNIGHRLMLAKWLMDAGASVFLFDYREYGKSEGKKDLNGIVTDTRAAYLYLIDAKRVPASKIVVYGESVGGGPACAIASSAQVGGIILDSTFTSLLHVAKKKVPFFNVYPDFLQPDPAFNNKETIEGSHGPLLIVHGLKDEVIPLSEAQENFAAASHPKTLLELPNSTHNWKEPDADKFVAEVRKFLETIK